MSLVPELPEVETIRAQLAPRLEGRTLVRVEILDPRLTRPHDLFEVAEELEGDRVLVVERRGKYLLFRLESGLALLVHLRMTGGFGFSPTSHERAVLELDDGSRRTSRRRTAPSRSGRASPPRGSPDGSGIDARRSRQSSSINESWPVSGTSTRTRRSGGRG